MICTYWRVPLNNNPWLNICPLMTLEIYQNDVNDQERKMFRESLMYGKKATLDNNRNKVGNHIIFYTSCYPNKEFYLKDEGIEMIGAFATSGHTTYFDISVGHKGICNLAIENDIFLRS